MRQILERLEAGCSESELNDFTCPVCAGTLSFEVVPSSPKAMVDCREHPVHLMAGLSYPYWARPAVMPAWWLQHRHPEVWDD